MTAYGTVEIAVEAMKEGAYDFITKPFKRAHVVAIVRQGAREAGARASRTTRCARARGAPPAHIVGQSLACARTMDLVNQAAPIGGDRAPARRERHRQGAGRAHAPLARAAAPTAPSWRSTARRSPRRCSRASCSATRRAPSPAPPRRSRGRFELADGGTLFLDEIGELPPTAAGQAPARAAGAASSSASAAPAPSRSTSALVAATNRDLRRQLAHGRFREDLYYRLAVFLITQCRRCAIAARGHPAPRRTTSCDASARRTRRPSPA